LGFNEQELSASQRSVLDIGSLPMSLNQITI